MHKLLITCCEIETYKSNPQEEVLGHGVVEEVLIDYEEQWADERGIEQLHLTLGHVGNLKHSIHVHTRVLEKYVSALENAYYKPAGNFCRYHAKGE